MRHNSSLIQAFVEKHEIVDFEKDGNPPAVVTFTTHGAIIKNKIILSQSYTQTECLNKLLLIGQ